ncbi:MAG: sulfatase [Hyphomonas sp.]|uniref:sulfatase n=1 Tax=Hyphomonas sp. TaxID=87 RepID=UPI003527BBF4
MSVRPNILFIVADDLNAWIGPLGRHPQVQTPNIDRLAARSVVFERAYCPAPYCNASRMSVFTGLRPSTSGIYQNEPFFGQAGRAPTYFEQLRSAGYHLFGAGKVFHGYFDYRQAGAGRTDAPWIDMHAHDSLWDRFVHNTPEPMPPGRPLNRMFDFDRFDTVDPWNHHFDWGVLPDGREADMPDRLSVNAALDFLAAPPAGQPFFCAVGLYKPHLPWYAPKRFFDLYPLDSVVLPVVNEHDLDDVPPMARMWARTPDDHAAVLAAGQWREAVQGYLAAISYCDAEIGRLLDGLDASPAGRDTIIALWGDNGFHLGEKLHWRKFVLWEEATRVPLILSRPAGDAPGRVEAPVSLLDLFPTLCDLAGAPGIPGADGISLRPLMDGEATAPRPVLTTWQEGNHSLRHGSWRYTRYADATEELYDQAADPLEWTNLAASPAHAADLQALRTLLTGLV